MNVLLLVIPLSLTFGLGFLVAFLWAVENDQLKNMEQKASAILEDEKKGRIS